MRKRRKRGADYLKTGVYFTFEKRLDKIEKPAKLIKKCCAAVCETMNTKCDCEVSVLICDSTRIHELNKAYRNVDSATDVLSFPLDKEISGGVMQLGDIVINRDRVYSQAKEYAHPPKRELAFLTVHSMLHLFGYDHEKEEDKLIMRRLEEEILTRLGLVRDI